ncbi:MAG: quercetin 2,3-dioxygenase [Actinomycetales bacterium]
MTAQFGTRPASSPLPGTPAPFFLAKGEGERAHIFDSLVTVLLSADETEGQFGVFTLEAPAGQAIPTHSHDADNEIFFVLDGAVRVFIQATDGQVHSRLLRPGDFGYCPAKHLHTFRVEEHARMLGVNTGGFERFFAAAGTPTDSRELPEPPYIPTPEHLQAAAEHFGNRFAFGVRLDES